MIFFAHIHYISETFFRNHNYVNDIIHFWYRKSLSKFRFGMSKINDSFLKFDTTNHIDKYDRICPFCPNQMEDEMPFLLICPKYKSLRVHFLFREDWRPTAVQFFDIMSNQSQELNINVSKFIHKALQH